MGRLRHMIILICCLVMMLPAGRLVAQQNIPYEMQEYVNPDELVTLSSDTAFEEAIRILNSFAKEYEDKVIINQSNISGPIGLNIPTMHWRQALNYIATVNDLYVERTPEYYEVKPRPGKTAGKEESPREQQITMGTREVKISATFFEGNRRLLRELGVDWSVIKNGKVTIDAAGAQNVSQSELFTVDVDWMEIAETGWQISEMFSTFEASNEGEILSSPTIKVVEGKEGFIQVGQDFSIKQRDIAGNVTDQFFSVGTILEVTPYVIRRGDTSFIHLEIRAEKSTAQPDPVSTIINKQESETQVLLLNGEETVIAGLYSTDESTVRRGIPFLKDLPPWFFGLRYIFGYDSKDVSKRELVIFMKAEIVPSLEGRMESILDNMENSLEQRRQEYKELDEYKQ